MKVLHVAMASIVNMGRRCNKNVAGYDEKRDELTNHHNIWLLLSSGTLGFEGRSRISWSTAKLLCLVRTAAAMYKVKLIVKLILK